jgi:ABC-2 type transport system ATP-binding protein
MTTSSPSTMPEHRSPPIGEAGEGGALEVVGLRKRFGLLRHGGAGKTTLIPVLLGLTRPDGGEIRVLGHRLPGARAPGRRRSRGWA